MVRAVAPAFMHNPLFVWVFSLLGSKSAMATPLQAKSFLFFAQNELQQKISAVIGGREEYNMEKQNRQARLDALQVRPCHKGGF